MNHPTKQNMVKNAHKISFIAHFVNVFKIIVGIKFYFRCFACLNSTILHIKLNLLLLLFTGPML